MTITLPEPYAAILRRLAETMQLSPEEALYHLLTRAGGGGGPSTFPLTGRELQVLQLLTEGANNKAIAEVLFLSEKTVKHHVHNILGKLQVKGRTGAAALAIRQGLVTNRNHSVNPHGETQ